jgi:hypothetical protein
MLWMILVLGGLNAVVGLMLFFLIVTIRRQTTRLHELRRQFDATLKEAGEIGAVTDGGAGMLPRE